MKLGIDWKLNMGKGSKPRNNWSKQFKNNYDDICWHDYLCYNCGDRIHCNIIKKYPQNFIFHKDGKVEHRNCNFN